MTGEEAIKEAYGIPVTKAQHEALQILIPELSESEDERIIRRIHLAVEDHFSSDGMVYHEDMDNIRKEIYAWLEKQKGQKPAECSEEDDGHIDAICRALTDNMSNIGFYTTEALCSWLKSLRPQPHEELNEEEVDFFIEDVKFPFKAKEKSTGKIVTITSGTENEDGASYVFFWSGKNRYLPEDLLKIKYNWKPSEEQMRSLKWQINNTSEGSWQRKESESLYNDLKKLM